MVFALSMYVYIRVRRLLNIAFRPVAGKSFGKETNNIIGRFSAARFSMSRRRPSWFSRWLAVHVYYARTLLAFSLDVCTMRCRYSDTCNVYINFHWKMRNLRSKTLAKRARLLNESNRQSNRKTRPTFRRKRLIFFDYFTPVAVLCRVRGFGMNGLNKK